MATDEEISLVRSGSLDQLVLSAPKRLLSENECLDLIALADSLKQFDERKRDRSVLEEVEQLLDLKGNYPVAVAYEIAQILRIPASYIDRAANLRYPSAELQLRDINEQGAVPSFDSIVNTYIKMFKNRLQQNLPQNEFVWSIGDYGDGQFGGPLSTEVQFKKVSPHQLKRKFLGWKWTKLTITKSPLANFYFRYGPFGRPASAYYRDLEIPQNKFNLRVELYDPIFLRACGDTLKELNQHFRPQLQSYEVMYHYVVE